jgi:hypothetical protein
MTSPSIRRVDSDYSAQEDESLGGRRISSPSLDSSVPPFITRVAIQEITEKELQRREALIDRMGNSPLDDLPTRAAKYMSFMYELWTQAVAVVRQTGGFVLSRLRSRGKNFDEFEASVIVFTKLFTQNVLSLKYIFLREKNKIFPVEILYAENILNFVSEVRQCVVEERKLYQFERLENTVLEMVVVETSKGRNAEVCVYSGNWGDVRISLFPKNLGSTIKKCVGSYVEYMRLLQREGVTY